MNRQEIVKKLAEIINEATDIEVSDIHEDSMLMDDLELSSLEIMTITADVEKAFRIRFVQSEMMKIETVGDLAEIVENKL